LKATPKILILEDEQRAGEKLQDLIKNVSPDATIYWERSISDGISFLTKQNPDLIFSDIQLLDGSVFEVFNSLTPKCPVIFCTAFDRFYVDAFKTNGIAYLLKPYTKEQFGDAWQKYNLLFETEKPESVGYELLDSLKDILEKKAKNYKRKFPIKKRDGVFLLDVDDISYFQAQGEFVFAFDNKGKKHIINQSLASIYELVDPSYFFMINRSEIVQMDSILKYSPYIKNRLAITLKVADVTLYTSNSRTPKFREWLEQ